LIFQSVKRSEVSVIESPLLFLCIGELKSRHGNPVIDVPRLSVFPGHSVHELTFNPTLQKIRSAPGQFKGASGFASELSA
jgi:hypothetical protein